MLPVLFLLLLSGTGGLVTLTGESSGKLYPLGKPGCTWRRETTFEKKEKDEDLGNLTSNRRFQ